MPIKLTTEQIDPWSLIAEYEQSLKGRLPGMTGACTSFIGTMRDFNEGDQVKGMSLEHYPGMTEKHLEQVCEKAQQKWELLDTYITHRVGELTPDDAIVVVAVWSSHRKDAFEACRFIMEELKSNVPLWKREILNNDSSRWVEKNSKGY